MESATLDRKWLALAGNTRYCCHMTNTKTALKLGDLVTAQYGDVTVTGIIDMFDYSGYVCLKFKTPQDLGNRVESDGVAISPYNRCTIQMVEAGPAITDDRVGEVPGCGVIFLRAAVA